MIPNRLVNELLDDFARELWRGRIGRCCPIYGGYACPLDANERARCSRSKQHETKAVECMRDWLLQRFRELRKRLAATETTGRRECRSNQMVLFRG